MSKRSLVTGGKARTAESVMVVEPDVLVRMTVAEYLRECGYRVVEAITGEEALSLLGRGVEVDVVLSAVKLPGALDGFSLAQRVRSHDRRIDVILTTGMSMTAMKAGELCSEGPGNRRHDPDLIVKRLKLLFERRRSRTG